MPCSNCHSEGRSLRTKMPIHMDLSTRVRRAIRFLHVNICKRRNRTPVAPTKMHG